MKGILFCDDPQHTKEYQFKMEYRKGTKYLNTINLTDYEIFENYQSK
jgi:hypothetical protein